MEYGFNIDIDANQYNVDDIAVENFKTNLDNATVNLKNYLLQDNITIDAQTVIKHLFPSTHCDVFISHSYSDQSLAIQLALDLKKKGITAFIDSAAWGSAYDLLKAIDEKHCRPDKKNINYNYEMRNRSTAHVYMILTTALQQMITNSTALFFLNTDNSLSTQHSIEKKSKTHSPWIHMELMFSYFIWQAKQNGRHLVIANESAMDSVPVVHEANTEHLKAISGPRLQRWINGRAAHSSTEEIKRSLHSLHESA